MPGCPKDVSKSGSSWIGDPFRNMRLRIRIAHRGPLEHRNRPESEICLARDYYLVRPSKALFQGFCGLWGYFWAPSGSLGRHCALGGGLMWHMQGSKKYTLDFDVSYVFIDMLLPGRGFSLETIEFSFLVF